MILSLLPPRSSGDHHAYRISSSDSRWRMQRLQGQPSVCFFSSGYCCRYCSEPAGALFIGRCAKKQIFRDASLGVLFSSRWRSLSFQIIYAEARQGSMQVTPDGDVISLYREEVYILHSSNHRYRVCYSFYKEITALLFHRKLQIPRDKGDTRLLRAALYNCRQHCPFLTSSGTPSVCMAGNTCRLSTSFRTTCVKCSSSHRSWPGYQCGRGMYRIRIAHRSLPLRRCIWCCFSGGCFISPKKRISNSKINIFIISFIKYENFYIFFCH